MAADKKVTPSGVKSAGLTLDVLETVAASKEEIGLSEIAVKLGITKPSISRHLKTLLDRGYLLRNPANSRYRLGIRCHLLFKLAEDQSGLFDVAVQEMKDLRDLLGQTVTLAAVSRDKITILDRAIGRSPLEIGVRPGSDIPIHASAHGKVALAFSRYHDVDALDARNLVQWTEETCCNIDTLRQEVERVRYRHWAVAPSEMLLGINALSAPIFDAQGDCIATIAVVGSIQFVRPDPDPEQIAAILESALLISRSIGGTTDSLAGQIAEQ